MIIYFSKRENSESGDLRVQSPQKKIMNNIAKVTLLDKPRQPSSFTDDNKHVKEKRRVQIR